VIDVATALGAARNAAAIRKAIGQGLRLLLKTDEQPSALQPTTPVGDKTLMVR
jgi:hypothetical protein